MDSNSYLNPTHMQAQCSLAIRMLEKDNTSQDTVINSLNTFIQDEEIKSSAFDSLKQHVSDYKTIIRAIKSANDSDIADYQTLSGAVGSEVLIGSDILVQKEISRTSKINNENRADTYSDMAATEENVILAAHYRFKEYRYRNLAEIDQQLYERWQEKEDAYDAIESATSGLFAASEGLRSAIAAGISDMSGAFQGGTYVPNMGASWRTEIEGATKTALKNDLPATMKNLSEKSIAEMTEGELEQYMMIVEMLVSGELTEQEMGIVLDAYYTDKIPMCSRDPKESAKELAYALEAYLKGGSAVGVISPEDIQRGTVMIAALTMGSIYELGDIQYDEKTRTYTLEYTSGYYRNSILGSYTPGGTEEITVGEVEAGSDATDKADQEGDKLLGEMLGFDVSDQAKGIIRYEIIAKLTEASARVVKKTAESVMNVATWGVTIAINSAIDYVETKETASDAKAIVEMDDGGLAMEYLNLYYASAIGGEGSYQSKRYPSAETATRLEVLNHYFESKGEKAITYDEIYNCSPEVADRLREIPNKDKVEIKEKIESALDGGK